MLNEFQQKSLVFTIVFNKITKIENNRNRYCVNIPVSPSCNCQGTDTINEKKNHDLFNVPIRSKMLQECFLTGKSLVEKRSTDGQT